MDSKKLLINLIITILKQKQIKYVVISPGGTNMEFVRAIEGDPFFECYSVVDERSAIYFAIGLYLQTGEIVATSCTSAQATRNYIPGLTEAFYKHVPILAITMSKHQRFTGQEYMQAPNQCSLPNDCVKASYWLPYIADENEYLYARRMVNEAVLKLKDKQFGPVQLCVPWVDFPIQEKHDDFSIIQQYGYEDEWPAITKDKAILIVIGEHRPFEEKLKTAIEDFANNHNCIIYTNHLSNYHSKNTVEATLELTKMTVEDFERNFKPDILVTIGGQTGDYPLYKLLSKREITGIEHWRISESSEVVDTYDKLSRIYLCSEMYFFKKYSQEGKTDNHCFAHNWQELTRNKKIQDNYPLSNVYVASKLSHKIPTNSTIQFSILNSLRVWNCFPINPTVKCYSNVGAFGIDGGLSTLIGQSVVTDKLAYMVIGDLAFYYDMNSLGIRHIKNNVKIILVNNNGGIEFKLNHNNHTEIDRYTAAANHFKNARGWAETCGFYYIEIKRKEDLIQNKKYLINHFEKPVLMEVFITDKDDYAGYKKIVDANRDLTFSYLMKKGISKIVNR